MMTTKWLAPLALTALLVTTGVAQAQPQSKLLQGLDKATIEALWCSSLLLEEAWYYDEDSDEAIEYENMAYDLGDNVEARLEARGLSEAEIEDVWTFFDEAAMDLATDDEDSFYRQLENCESNFDAMLNR